MEKALINNATIDVVQNGGTVAINGAADVTFVAFGNNTFKLQGSSDAGATYSDIATSAMTSDTTIANRDAVSVFRSLFDHIKVVLDAGYCVIIRHNLRVLPSGHATTIFAKKANTKIIVDPILGTA